MPPKDVPLKRYVTVQAFTEAAMRLYLPTILDVSRYTMERWEASKEPVLFYTAARAFAFDIAATVLTGTRLDGDILGRPPHTKWHKFKSCHAHTIDNFALIKSGTSWASACREKHAQEYGAVESSNMQCMGILVYLFSKCSSKDLEVMVFKIWK